MRNPFITIITPSFNQGNYLEETILSVIHQEGVDFEYMVIDGGSTDHSIDIIKKYETHFSFWCSEKDRGQSHAINKGIEKAKGDIIMWINSDDILLPGALKKIEEAFIQHPDALLVHGKSLLFGAKRKNLQIGELKSDHHLRCLAYIPFPQPGSAFSRKLIDQYGPLDESLHFGMDFELLVRAALQRQVLSLPEILSKYRIHDNSKTNLHLKFANDWQQVFSKAIQSIASDHEMVKGLIHMGYLEKEKLYYRFSSEFTSEEISKIIFYHLEIQFHYTYLYGNRKENQRIAELLKALFPDDFKKQFIKWYRRKQYFPGSLLNLFRKIKNANA